MIVAMGAETLATGNHHLVVVIVDANVYAFLRGLRDFLRGFLNVKTKIRIHQIHRRYHEERRNPSRGAAGDGDQGG